MRATKYARQITEIAHRAPWLYKAGAQLYIDKNFPRHLFIETTANCNLTCSYCPREDNQSDMDYSLFKKIIDEASEYGPRSFSLHLFGEPLLYSHVLDSIRYIKRKNRKNVVLVTTNGTRLNSLVDDLIRLETDEIIWSWRPEAKFKPETKEKLYKATKKGKTKFRVRILKEVTPQEEIENWKNWPCVEIRNLHNYGGEIDLSKYNAPNVDKRWPCYHLWFAPAVAWNGNILLCCVDPHQKEVLGNIKRHTIAEIWQSGQLNLVRKKHLEGTYDGICKDCDVWKSYPNFFFGKEYPWQSSHPEKIES